MQRFDGRIAVVTGGGTGMGRDPKELSDDQIDEARERMARLGFDLEGATNDDIRTALVQRAEEFRDDAPMTAADAARIILDGVRAERWRILVGDDAAVLDRLVRETPEEAYDAPFMERLVEESGWKLGTL